MDIRKSQYRVARKSLPKDIVAKERYQYQTDDELKVAVTVAFETITCPMLRNMSHRTWRRMILCSEHT